MPEFGTVSAIVMATAIVSIVAVSYRTGPRLMPHHMRKEGQISIRGPDEHAYKRIIGRYPHKSMSLEDIQYVNSLYGKKL